MFKEHKVILTFGQHVFDRYREEVFDEIGRFYITGSVPNTMLCSVSIGCKKNKGCIRVTLYKPTYNYVDLVRTFCNRLMDRRTDLIQDSCFATAW